MEASGRYIGSQKSQKHNSAINGNMKHKADFGKSHFKIISDPSSHPHRKLVFINSPSGSQ